MREFWNSLSHLMKPRFHEISMYLIALSFCWLFIFHPELRWGFYMFFTGFESMSPLFLSLGLIVTAGLLLSLIHAFIKRKKLAIEKIIMGWSILGISGVTSFFTGVEMLPSRSSIMAVLVAWNIIMSVLTLTQMGMQKYDITENEATILEVILTTALLMVILFFLDSYLHFSWAKTLSICIFYAYFIVLIAAWTINYFGIKIPDFLKE
jgi:hypothetical protein